MFGFVYKYKDVGSQERYLRLIRNPLKELSSIFIYPEREVKCTEEDPKSFLSQGFWKAPVKASPVKKF